MRDRADAVQPAQHRRIPLWNALREAPFFNVLIAIVVSYAALTLITGETFSTTVNQITIMRSASVFLILAVGQTLVMTTGGIDISTGSMIGVVGAIIGTAVTGDWMPAALAIPLALLLGAALGAFNGFNVTVLGVPPLLATLGTFVAYRGFTQYYMGVNLVAGLPEPIPSMGRAYVLGLPVPVWIALLVTLIGWFVLRRTLYGRYITAIGSNPVAARATRLNVRAITASTYVIQGALAGLAALVLMGRLDSASAAMGEGLELHIIAAVVLGGTYLFGGRSTMIGTLLGVYLIGMRERPHPDGSGIFRAEDDPRPSDHRCGGAPVAAKTIAIGVRPAHILTNQRRRRPMNRLTTRLAAAGMAVAGAAAAQDDQLRIGFVSHSHDITDLFGQLEIGFRNRLDEEGLDYEMFQANPERLGPP